MINMKVVTDDPTSICFFLDNKTITEACYGRDKRGNLNLLGLEVNNKIINIYPEIVFHGHEEYPAEVKLVVEMVEK
jgi:hypothetical protein